MYKFRDLRRVRGPSKDTRPIEAVNFDGHWLDDEISAFETLNIEGRNDFKRSINSQELSQDGSLYLSSRIPEKQIKVNFYWKAESIEKFNRDSNKLKLILSKPQKKVRFLDEQNYYYVGTIEELTFENPTLTTKGSFTITCSNPFKFSDTKIIDNLKTKFEIGDEELIYPSKPKKITIIPNEDGSNIEIKNLTTNKKLIANLSFSKGKEIVFDFDKLDFLVDKVSHLIDIDLASNFDDFLIKNHDQISINVEGNHQIEYEVKQL